MRIIVLGFFTKGISTSTPHSMFEVYAIGYCFRGNIYFKKKGEIPINLVGVVCEGMDF